MSEINAAIDTNSEDSLKELLYELEKEYGADTIKTVIEEYFDKKIVVSRKVITALERFEFLTDEYCEYLSNDLLNYLKAKFVKIANSNPADLKELVPIFDDIDAKMNRIIEKLGRTETDISSDTEVTEDAAQQ